jgi:hypothetical protein
VVIRRLGKLEQQNFEEWDDDVILAGGAELSLFQSLRQYVRKFLENKYIEKLILSMTIFLCVVIFSELSISEYLVKPDDSKTEIGWIYYYINYFLLTFFILEIMLKLFGYAHIFLMEMINVFDSIVVIISFVFQVIGADLKFVGLLRILRLIKVITEMKRVADTKKAKQEAIKK